MLSVLVQAVLVAAAGSALHTAEPPPSQVDGCSIAWYTESPDDRFAPTLGETAHADPCLFGEDPYHSEDPDTDTGFDVLLWRGPDWGSPPLGHNVSF